MKFLMRMGRQALFALFGLAVLGVVTVGGVYFYFEPGLPPIEVLREVRMQVPLRIYDRDGGLMAEFGEKRRIPKQFSDIPPLAVKAVLAAEDDRFFEHPGVDYHGLLRAAAALLLTGEKKQGGSTITMQVARNFFLSSEKTFERKIKEVLLAIKIEQSLSKEEILALYLNKIYLGQRAYGLGAAAQVYYGKELEELSLAQLAMLAGLPKAPSRFNPIADPERALERRNAYVLRRMRDLDHITEEQYQQALAEPLTERVHAPPIATVAPHVAEMVRAQMVSRFGDDAYTSGFRVYTTLDPRHQAAAQQGLAQALEDYDLRHGWRGPERRLEGGDLTPESAAASLKELPVLQQMSPAAVLEVSDQEARLVLASGERLSLNLEAVQWARPYQDESTRGPRPTKVSQVLTAGDVVRVRQNAEGLWRLAQVPRVEGAFVALAPADGALLALSGGYNFYRSNFNRAVQAMRQPGSGFKPFLYAAALEAGFTPTTLINDAPLVHRDPWTGQEWRPENFGGKFYGPTRLREGLAHSRNLVSIRLLQAVGVAPVVDFATRFGFARDRLPPNLTLALGSGTTTPLEIATAYAAFANGGFKVEPWFIQRIEDLEGRLLEQFAAATACPECPEPEPGVYPKVRPAGEAAEAAAIRADATPAPPAAAPAAPTLATDGRPLAPRIMSPQVHFLIHSMMQDVIRKGTARRALALKRTDLAGKTGTTNEQRDAWFSGFNRDVTATVWVGFDAHTPLGNDETGGKAALPAWISYMGEVLKDKPARAFPIPPNVYSAKIDAASGQPAEAGEPGAISEWFAVGTSPEDSGRWMDDAEVPGDAPPAEVQENLF